MMCRDDMSIPLEQQIKLDFILSHTEGDERPYLTVNIFGHDVLALLDSGASRTCVGRPGFDFLRSLGISIKSKPSVCTVANGEHCETLGDYRIPIKLRDRVKVFDVLVVPSLPHFLILGADFWRDMGVVPNLRNGEWVFSSPSDRIDSILAHSDISDAQSRELETLIQSCFPEGAEDTLGCTSLVEHHIVTNSPPIKQRYYPLSPALQKVANEELDRMLKLGIVEPSKSPWASPILLVPKKDGTRRFCVDFRKLNQVSVKDSYPLPYVSQTLDKLRDAKYLTSLDIKSAYHQIPVAESSRDYTAFTVPGRGLFRWCRMPFGLSSAPATFQRFIDQVLGPELEPYVFVYLDDIIILTPTFEQHIKILREVLDRLKNAGLTLNKDKCQFCREELKYLGYVVNKQGLLVDPEKIKAILEIPSPRNVSEVRRLVGMASWYRRFVPDFSTIIAPLTNLLRKNVRFIWTVQCQQAWEKIRDRLVSAPILCCPDFTQEFTIQTDASDFGLGAVLSQTIDGEERVICFLSKSLTPQERKFSTVEKECLAVLWSIEKLRPYVEGSHFTVITDHYSLIWLSKLNSPSGRLARWSVRLQQYDFTIIHRKGKDHVVPDALSRSVPVIDLIANSVSTTDQWYLKMYNLVRKFPAKYPAYQIIDNQLCKYVRPSNKYFVSDNDVWRKVVPKDLRLELIRQCHDEPTSGHLGIFKTLSRLSVKYFWPKMVADVVRYVRRCTVCLKAKPDQRKPVGFMGGHTLIDKPWDVLSIDLLGPLPRSKRGFAYILAVTDCFSKFTLTFPLRKASAAAVVKHLENDVFLLFGAPFRIISDNGQQFRSKEYRQLLSKYKVRSSYTSFYTPRANPVERFNRTLKTCLISYVSQDQREWDLVLPKVSCAIRTAKHEVTGHTPYFVNFGRELNITGERFPSVKQDDSDVIDCRQDPEELMQRSTHFSKLYRDIKTRLQKSYEQSKQRYDLRRRQEYFMPEQVVWRKNFVLSDAAQYFSAKLADKYLGPFMINRRIGSNSYELKTCAGDVMPGTWSAEHLRAQPCDD